MSGRLAETVWPAVSAGRSDIEFRIAMRGSLNVPLR